MPATRNSVHETLLFQMEEPMKALVHAVCSVRPLPYYYVDRPVMRVFREIVARHANIEIADAVIGSTKHLTSLKKKFISTK